MKSVHMMSLRATLALLIAVACLSFAPAVLAQEDPLSAAIRAAITADAENENLSEEEIDAIVEALARQAELDGVTADDITWRPQETTFTPTEGEEQNTCGSMPSMVCALNKAFGFSGDNILIPALLFGLSVLLILAIAMAIHSHKHHAAIAKTPPPTINTPRPPYGPPPPTNTTQPPFGPPPPPPPPSI